MPVDSPRRAPIIWFEIYVSGIEQARQFYGDLFGWAFESLDAYDKDYWCIKAGENGIHGALALRDSDQYPGLGTVVYVQVEDLKQALARATDLGGSVARPPTVISETDGSFALIRDLDSNVIGLWAK